VNASAARGSGSGAGPRVGSQWRGHPRRGAGTRRAGVSLGARQQNTPFTPAPPSVDTTTVADLIELNQNEGVKQSPKKYDLKDRAPVDITIPELDELEELIQQRGYDPRAIDEYFWNHPLRLASRALETAKALTTISWLVNNGKYDKLVPAIEKLGPSYVKFGQALASRSDLVGDEVAMALETLQDGMAPAPIALVRAIVEDECPAALQVLDQGQAFAAASLSQVYRGVIDGKEVAVKVQRPGIASRVAADAALLRTVAKAVEFTAGRRIKASLLDAVDEFAGRIFEEMDFVNEAANIKKFDALYGPNGTSRKALPPPGFVRVPGLFPSIPATRRVLVMEWMEGQRVMSLVSKNKDAQSALDTVDEEECTLDTWEEKECARRAASLPLIDLGIRCTLSQLIETGVMHADPHGGNLIRMRDTGDLAYLDFGLVSEIPASVRDGLVAAVTLLIFSRDYKAVAGLFGELQLVPQDIIENPYQFESLTKSLENAAAMTLSYPDDDEAPEGETPKEARLRRARCAVPEVSFDKLLGALLALVPLYRFVLPPYFLNNARALGTLEGMARSADPTFNILAVVYPFAVKRLLANPTGSKVLRKVLRQLVRDERTKRFSLSRLQLMIDDAAALTKVPRWHIVRSALRTRQGWSLVGEAMMAGFFWGLRKVLTVVSFLTGVTLLKFLFRKTMNALMRDGDAPRPRMEEAALVQEGTE